MSRHVTTSVAKLLPAVAYSRKPEWSSSYRWAERSQLVRRNPLVGIRKPPRASRGAKALISADDRARLVAHAAPLFRSFLRLLHWTGASPAEIADLRAEAVEYKQGVSHLTAQSQALRQALAQVR